MVKSLKIILLVLGLVILIFSFIFHKIPLSRFQKAKLFEARPLSSLPLSSLKSSELSENVSPNYENASRSLARLTIEQKVGQLFLIGFEGKEFNQEIENLLQTLHPGGFLLLSRNIKDKDQLKKLIELLQKTALKDTGLPLFVAVDQEGGKVCRISFLNCTSQSEIEDKEQAFQLGFERAKELKDLGINLNLAPVLDEGLAEDFIYERTFQAKIEEAGELAESLISGQKKGGIFTAIKHFPGYGGISFNPETEKLPIFSQIPGISQFQKAMKARVEMVMVANAIYSEIDKELPFSLSPKGIKFLKEILGEDILIISDDLSSPILKKEFSLEKTITLAQKAGLDILLISGFWDVQDPIKAYNALLAAVREGKISEKEIDRTFLEIIELKKELGG